MPTFPNTRRIGFALVAGLLGVVAGARVLANGTIDTTDSAVAAGGAPLTGTVTVEPCDAPGPAPAHPSIGAIETLGPMTGTIPAFPGGGTGALGAVQISADVTLPGGVYECTSYKVDRSVIVRYLDAVTIRTTGNVVLEGQVIVDSGSATFECAGDFEVPALSAIPVAGVETFSGLIKLDVAGVMNFHDVSPEGSQATSSFGTQGGGDMDFIARGGVAGADLHFGFCSLFARHLSFRSAKGIVIDSAGLYSFHDAGMEFRAFGGDFEILNSNVTSQGTIITEASGGVVGSQGFFRAVKGAVQITSFGGDIDLTRGFVQTSDFGDVVLLSSAGVALRNGAQLQVVDSLGDIGVRAFGGDVTIQSPPGNPYNLVTNDGGGDATLFASGGVLIDGGAALKVNRGDLTLRAFGGNLTCSGTVSLDDHEGPLNIGATGDVTAASGGDIKLLADSLVVVGDRLDLAAQLLARTGAIALNSRRSLAGVGTMESATNFTATAIDGDVTFDGSTITTTGNIPGLESGDILLETFAGATGGRIAARHGTLRTGDHPTASGDVTLRIVTVPRPTVTSYLLPTNVTVKLGAVRGAGLKAQGTIGCPGEWLGPATPAALPFTLSVGQRGIAGDLTLRPNGRDRELKTSDALVRVSPSKTGNSKGVFSVQIDGDLTGAVPANGLVEFRMTLGGAEFRGTVRLAGGKFKLGSARGAVAELLYPLAATIVEKGGGKDSVALTIGFATDGVTPGAATDVEISLGDGFKVTVAAADFVIAGDKFTAKNPPSAPGITQLLVDFDKEQVVVKGKNLDLGGLPAGTPVATRIGVSFGGDIRSVDVTLSRNGTKLTY